MKNNKLFILSFIFSLIILALSLRGHYGTPTETDLLTQRWAYDGPFEVSPERGRYALTYSVIENNSLAFSLNLARFASPDVGYINDKYVSLFAPGVSFIAMPFYILGKELGAAQLGTFATITIFALINLILIFKILKKLGVNGHTATLSSLIFLFATPAFTYAITFYQHHITTAMLLYSLLQLLNIYESENPKVWNYMTIWILCGFSVVIDNPNLFFMLPVGIAAAASFFKVKTDNLRINLSLQLKYVFSMFVMIIPISLFMWFNYESNGDYFKVSGAVKQAKAIDEEGKPTESRIINPREAEKVINPAQKKKDPIKFFKTRNMLNGFYILLLSPDRGTLHYAPLMLLALLGIYAATKKQNGKFYTVLLSTVLMIFLLYAMWGDPWGGWAFGARYLIPSYAILALFLGILLEQYKSWLLRIIVLALFIYSSSINLAGAITTSALPPQVEVLELEAISGVEQKYTYERNFDMIKAGYLKTASYSELFYPYITAWNFYLTLEITLVLIFLLNLIIEIKTNKGLITTTRAKKGGRNA